MEVPVASIWGQNDLDEVEQDVENFPSLFDKNVGNWNYIHSGGHEVPSGANQDDMKQVVKIARRAITEAYLHSI